MRVHLVDGTFELFRCFHGAPRHAIDGSEVGAVRGFAWSINALVRKHATHIAVAFDGMTTRIKPGEAASDGALIRSQYLLATDVLRALGVTLWPMIRFQADDALAAGAVRYRDHPAVEQVVICTTDKDLTQCVVGDRVVLWDRIRDQFTNEADARARFGVAPAQMPEYFALVGDPSDGLPGVPGWGAKATATVLARYPTIEEIPADAKDWDVEVRGRGRLAKMLGERRREAILMRNLSRLRTDVPLVDEVADLEWKGANGPELTELAHRLEMADILEKVARWKT